MINYQAKIVKDQPYCQTNTTITCCIRNIYVEENYDGDYDDGEDEVDNIKEDDDFCSAIIEVIDDNFIIKLVDLFLQVQKYQCRTVESRLGGLPNSNCMFPFIYKVNMHL